MPSLIFLWHAGLKNPSSEDTESTDDATQDDASSGIAAMVDLEHLPKFHINGKGETSGVKKWSAALRKVRLL